MDNEFPAKESKERDMRDWSFTGEMKPLCSVCNKPLFKGDDVIQTFRGKLTTVPKLYGPNDPGNELAVATEEYIIKHADCI